MTALVAIALGLAACGSDDDGSTSIGTAVDATSGSTAPSSATEISSSASLGSDSPDTEATDSEAPETEPPETELPETELAETEATGAEASGTGAPTTTQTMPTSTAEHSIEGRPFEVFTPSTYDPSVPMPLVVMLHGYTSSGSLQEAYFQFQRLAEERGFLYVHPDGTIDARGAPYWNATDACCNLTGGNAHDERYLLALIEEIEGTYAVDPAQIYFAGHSNGGFMSYRMACDHADKIAAVASLAGATFADVERCRPSEPVSVVQIHGTDDAVIAYDGGDILGNEFPSAATTAATWAAYNGCGAGFATGAAELDLEAQISGVDTSVAVFDACPTGVAVELWTIEGGSHSPSLSPTFAEHVVDFLLAHPKP
jgi:polyhydroxybutyrate depolymerase